MQNLLKKLKQHQITIDVINNKLDIKAPKGVMTKELLEEIKLNKQGLIDFILTYRSEKEEYISKASVKAHYELSSAQNRLWILDQIEHSNAYNMFSVFILKGILKIKVLERAFQKLIAKHEILRTNFIINKETGNPVQIIRPEIDFKLQIEKNSEESQCTEIITKETQFVFDLEKDQLIRVILIEKAANEYILVNTLHHIISDAWSSEIITSEVFSIYKQLLKNEIEETNEVNAIQYKDYAEWEQQRIKNNEVEHHKTYWIEQLSGELPILELPVFTPRPLEKTQKGRCIQKNIDKDVFKKYKTYCQSQDVTLFIGVLTIIKTLFYKYTSQTDIILGTPIAGREKTQLQNQIGFYVNTLALRTIFSKEDTFKELLTKVKKTTLEAYQHQEYPFDELVKNLNLNPDSSRNPLFDVIVTIADEQKQSYTIDELIVEALNIDIETSKFDLEFSFINKTDALELSLTYNTDVFTEFFILQLLKHVEGIMKAVIAAEEIAIKNIIYISDKEKETVVNTFNTTEQEVNLEKDYISLFREQIKGEEIAIVEDQQQISYNDLDRLSNELANYLLSEYHIKPEEPVGVMLDRDHWLITAFLAVLKTGGAYLPIATDYPQSRITYIKEDSACRVIIDKSFIEVFEKQQQKIAKAPQIKIKASQLAYIIYTSGTTGKPKGVQVEHKNLINLCYWHLKTYKVTHQSKATIYAGIAFDASIWEIAPYLLSGATLYPISDATIRLNIEALTQFFSENKITHTYIPTAICQEMIADDIAFENLTVLTGGDKLVLNKTPKFKLYNNYGPTENTIVTTVFDTSDPYESTIPIGKPIDNVTAYILDENLKPVPVGIPGKLYTGGLGVTRGYLNQPKLTSEKFIVNPFNNEDTLYDTGDIVKWLPNGNIGFIGRKDEQVKIRGYRIELEEIEQTILNYDSKITRVTVFIKDVESTKVLIAIYTGDEIKESYLKEYLQEQLPIYMIPDAFKVIPAFPLTPNGKIDRKALKEMEVELVKTKEYVEARTAIEQELVLIWEEVLGVEKIGIRDNFFELGGHSLKVVKLVNKLSKQDYNITVNTVFKNPEIELLAKAIKKGKSEKISIAPVQEYYPATSGQQRLWTLSQFAGGNQAYTITNALKIEGAIALDRLSEAVSRVLQKHESLRTIFKRGVKGALQQYVQESIEIEEVLEVRAIAEEEIEKKIKNYEDQEFDLEKGPLLRIIAFKLNKEETILLLQLHHIIGDGWSMEVLSREIIANYKKSALGENKEEALAIQYKDYAYWTKSTSYQEKLEASKAYWHEQLAGELPVLSLPIAKERPEIKTYKGSTYRYEFTSEFTKALKEYVKVSGATMFMGVLAGLNGLLYRYTGQTDTIIGTPVAGRNREELEEQIGLYLNTLAIRTRFSRDNSYQELLEKQKEVVLSSISNEHYPLERLVEELAIERDTSRSALFDIMVVYQNQQDLFAEVELGDLRVKEYEGLANQTSQFDMSFSFSEQSDQLQLALSYNTDIFDLEVIVRLVSHLENYIKAGIAKPEEGIDELVYINEEEKESQLQRVGEEVQIAEENLVALLQKQSESTPTATAIVCEESSWNYKEVAESSNKLANYIRERYRIGKGDLVGVKLKRDERLIKTIIGILKAGAAYVPMDKNYPEDRIAYIERDSQCKLTITVEILEEFDKVKEDVSGAYPEVTIAKEDLAYVIYTSGSTGKPKGVQISHGNAVAFINWSKEEYRDTDYEVIYAGTSHCFDLSIYEMFYPLSIGKKLRVLASGLNIPEWITRDEKILLNTVPSVITSLRKQEVDLGKVVGINMAGEPIPISLSNELVEKYPNIALRNLYGPSEDTTYSTCYRITKKHKESLPIGKPISNTQIYILSEGLSMQGEGLIGELCISGLGLSKGYLNKAELTKEKFVAHPYKAGEKLYKTGDLGYWRADGELGFIGRKDDQVKVRGYRIELGEVAHAIEQVEGVEKAIVIVREEKGEQQLVSYIEGEIGIDQIKEELEKRLPSYMIPTHYVLLDEFPYTPNGKVDKQELLKLEVRILQTKEYVGARTALEEELVSIWEEVLGVEKIGIRDNFFELGGHSLKLTRLRSLISESLGVTLNFEELFSYTTIEEQGEVIAKKSREEVIEIPKIVAQDKYVLSSAQQRIWMLSQFEGGNTAYNMPGVYELEGTVDKSVLEASFIALMKRHESLRTRFKEKEGELYQEILKENSIRFELAEKEVAGLAEAEREIEEAIAKEFDLSSGELLQAKYIRVSTGEQFLVLMMHHIISDGWSIGVMMHELIENYKELVAGRALKRAPLRIHYKDYAQWEQNYIRGEAIVESKAYWHEQLSGEIPIIDLPIAQERPKQKDYSGAQEVRFLSREITDGLKRLSQEKEMTLYMVVLAMIKLIIHRYSGAKDIIIGSPIAGRINKEIEDQIGVYINTLAIRTRYTGEERISALLDQVKNSVLKAYEHQRYPFDKLVEELPLARDIGRHPLFDIMVTMQNIDGSRIGSQKITEALSIHPYKQQRAIKSKFDLEFIIEEKSEGIEIAVQYSSSLYKAEAIKKLLVHLERLIKSSIAKPEAKLYEQEMLTIEEQEALIWGIKGKEEALVEETLIEAIRAQVARRGEAIAIGDGASEISYNELERRSNAIANYIEAHYPGEGPIGVLLDREVATIVVLLGIIKTGRAYIPLDPRYPQERIDYIITHSGLEVMIVGTGLEIEKAEGIAYISIEEIQRADTAKDRVAERKVTPSDTAYIIYTSGSTGNPKGVAIGHESLYNFLRSIQAIPGIGEQDTLYAVTTYAFDISILEFFVPLISGAKVYIASNEVLSDAKELIEEIGKVSPSVIQSTPSFYQMLYEVGWKGDKRCKILCGGDSLNEQLATRLIADNQELWNMYGPTETTIWSTQHRVLKGSAYKEIGRAINNTSLYVLGSQKELLPQGAIGELYIGGKGLAQGYYKAEELTQERFISNPYGEGKIYKTGDLVKLNESGNIEFIGRNDLQVKIRGYRIELGEVTSKLNKQKGVKQGVVLVKQDNVGNNMLVAYIEKATDDSIEGIRKELGESLPTYMLPSQYVEVSAFPLTPNGKIDRKALKEIEVELVKTKEYVEARTAIEQELVLIWEEVLGVEKIGIRDNFFELGGHSLKVVKLVNKLSKQDYNITVNTVFKNPEIELLAKAIKKGKSEKISIAPVQEYYPATSGQQRLWTLSQFAGGNQAYTITNALKIEGAIALDRLSEAVSRVLEKHESLRTIFKRGVKGALQQYVQESIEIEEVLEVRAIAEEEIEKEIKNYEDQEFDLEKGPLLRIIAFKLNKEETILLLQLHHIIGDGWSMEVLSREIIANYKKSALGENKEETLTIQYKDYAYWTKSTSYQEKLEGSRAYWHEQLAGELPVLSLPIAKERPEIKTYKGSTYRYEFTGEFTKALKEYVKVSGATMFMGVLAGLNGLLHRYTGQTDTIIGTPVAGRNREELEEQIGLYLNTLAIRTRFSRDNSYQELLEKQKEVVLSSISNEHYPLERLVEELAIERDTSRSALFDIMVVYQNQQDLFAEVELGDLRVKEYEGLANQTSQFDMSFSFSEQSDQLQLALSYNTDIFDLEVIVRLVSHLENYIKAGIAKPEEGIDELVYINEEEKESQLQRVGEEVQIAEENLVALLQKQSESTPTATAIVCEESSWNYKEVAESSNKLANYIRERYRIGKGDLVGVKLKRDERLIKTIIGILKAGAAYVPMDKNYPEDRIAYIERDSQCKLTITVEILEEFDKVKEDVSGAYPEVTIAKEDLAYVIYTSGSTGKPKGVQISHGNAVAFINWSKEEYRDTDYEVIYAGTSHCFDLSIYEMFYPLSIGKKLRVLASGLNIPEWITRDEKILLNTVPSVITSLRKQEVDLGKVVGINMAGEPIPISLSNELVEKYPNIALRNLYGPSEDTTYSTCYRITKKHKESLPIGKPISNTQIYILSEGLSMQGEGLIGELCISGLGLSKGYLNKAELTKEKFVAHPYKAGEKLYKTGDLGYWRADGELGFIGRKDDQVKVRGYRIELGEVAHAIEQVEGVEKAIVIVREEKGEQQLVSYIEGEIGIDQIKEELEKRLPSYMIPTHYVLLDEFPYTPNGKVDKQELLKLEVRILQTKEYVGARTALEEELVSIWEEVLGVEKIGIRDNFFELGGHSLKATELLATLHKKYEITINIQEIFKYPTIENLAIQIENERWIKESKTEKPVKKILI